MKTNNILDSIERIYIKTKDSKLQKSFFDEIEKDLKFLQFYTDLSAHQAVLFAVAIVLSYDENNLESVMKHLGLEHINILRYQKDIRELHLKRYLLRPMNFRARSRNRYNINDKVLERLSNDQSIANIHIKDTYTFASFLEQVWSLGNSHESEELNNVEFRLSFYNLLEIGEDLPFIKAIKEHELSEFENFLLFCSIWQALLKGDNQYHTQLTDIVEKFEKNDSDRIQLIQDFNADKSMLTQKEWLVTQVQFFENSVSIKLGTPIIEMLKETEDIIIHDVSDKDKSIIPFDSIADKSLYYNAYEEEEIHRLESVLENKSFLSLQERLKERNMPLGINILLYGSPGTGKTESVYQLARKTKRQIFKVDIAAMRSKWFGESQKLVRNIFHEYYKFKEKQDQCPILLLNEADGIISRRMGLESSNIQDTQNQIQNILLEELEDFEGILIATTNLQENIDNAFERRFLFKIKFDTPEAAIAAKIWIDKIPLLSQAEALNLADNYAFSGGEIENIARKCEIENLVLGKEINFDVIQDFCNTERWNKEISSKPIGFRKIG